MSIKDYVFYVDNCICGAYIFILPTLCCIRLRRCCFGLETRVIIKISTNPCYPRNWLIFMGMKQKKFLKKNPNWPTQKNWVFQNRQFSIFFVKILEIGPRVSRMNWCEGHQCGLTYMVVRLSNIRSKTVLDLTSDSLMTI